MVMVLPCSVEFMRMVTERQNGDLLGTGVANGQITSNNDFGMKDDATGCTLIVNQNNHGSIEFN